MAKDKEDQHPRYRVRALTFVDNHLRKPDDEITFSGYPGDSLEPLNEAAEKMAAEGKVKVAEAQRAMLASLQPIGTPDISTVTAAVTQALGSTLQDLVAAIRQPAEAAKPAGKKDAAPV